MIGARTIGALLLSLGLVACGGGSTPAPADPAAEEPASEEPVDQEQDAQDALCCCHLTTPSGDFHDDYSMTSPGECEADGGACVDGDTPGCPS